MLKWETRASETLLNVEKLARPFGYKLHIHADGKTREIVADIPETFNYLLGLHVQTRRVYNDDARRYLVYRARIDHRQVVVIWRETESWQKADLERDKKFVAAQKLTEVQTKYSSTSIRSSPTPKRWSQCSRPGCSARWRCRNEC